MADKELLARAAEVGFKQAITEFRTAGRNIDLTDANLNPNAIVGKQGTDQEGMSYFGVDLMQCDFADANLKGAKLQYAHIYGGVFRGADFTNADLAGMHACDTNFDGAIFRSATMTGAYIKWCTFNDAVLEMARLDRGTVAACTFDRAKMRRIHLEGSGLNECDFADAELNFADKGVYRASFAGACLSEEQRTAYLAALTEHILKPERMSRRVRNRKEP